jgi:hypothetical protein
MEGSDKFHASAMYPHKRAKLSGLGDKRKNTSLPGHPEDSHSIYTLSYTLLQGLSTCSLPYRSLVMNECCVQITKEEFDHLRLFLDKVKNCHH